jgi:hypothetical protein
LAAGHQLTSSVGTDKADSRNDLHEWQGCFLDYVDNRRALFFKLARSFMLRGNSFSESLALFADWRRKTTRLLMLTRFEVYLPAKGVLSPLPAVRGALRLPGGWDAQDTEDSASPVLYVFYFPSPIHCA